MPIVIPDNLPATEVLQNERVFVMSASQAVQQDIRPLKVVILNIMPLKIQTEVHLLRQLANTPLQLDIELLHTKTHQSKNTPQEHLQMFYKTFDDIKHQKFDGLIITGAPVEQMDFEEVYYWEEMKQILDWAKTNVTASLFICWAAQAAMYHYYKVPKYPLPAKMFGVFEHTVNSNHQHLSIVRGFNDIFLAPHSRHTEVRRADIETVADLDIIAESVDAGVYMVSNADGTEIFVTGHSEYDPTTLRNEYFRDKEKGLLINVPKNYFPNDDTSQPPIVQWRSHANLLFSNWVNYHVYQRTPYDIEKVRQ